MKEYRVIYPFHKGKRELYDEAADARLEKEVWEAGVTWDQIDEYEAIACADAVGTMVLVEIGRYTPPGYRERVFFTRYFIDPDGKEFGKKDLRMVGAAKFRRLCQGFRFGYVCGADNKEYPPYATKPYGDEQ